MYENGEWPKVMDVVVTHDDCAIEILGWLDRVVCARANFHENCNLFNLDGARISNCTDISNGSSVVMVPFDRLFIFAGIARGYKRVMTRMANVDDKPIILETSSLMPRIFKIQNFFTDEEANQLIANALAFSGDIELRRSMTGTGEWFPIVIYVSCFLLFSIHV